MGWVKTWGELLLCRMLLGLLEVSSKFFVIHSVTNLTRSASQAGFFPAVVFVITTFLFSTILVSVVWQLGFPSAKLQYHLRRKGSLRFPGDLHA